MTKKTLLYLPHELIVEILMRLPVKSLICFKCVSKSWFSLISDPHFANSQFQLTTHTHRIMCLSQSPTEFCSIGFEAFLNYDPNFVSHISFPISEFPFEIIGSCRGFIYLYCRTHTYLWNPSTGFKKQIPLSPFVSKLAPNYRHDVLRGFSYDQSRDDYLIVVLSNDPSFANVLPSHLEFFSIRDNRWKEIEGTHMPYGDGSNELLFNGTIHWLSCRLDIEIDVIVAFDLLDRKLFEMPFPDYFHQSFVGTWNFASGLWVFGEFFSLYAVDYSKPTIEIWVMKEYKVNLSWTKTLVLPLDIMPKCPYFIPICSTNNGDFIGTSPCSKLVKYNNKGQQLEFRSFRNGPSEIVLYTETLLSLPANNEQDYKLEE